MPAGVGERCRKKLGFPHSTGQSGLFILPLQTGSRLTLPAVSEGSMSKSESRPSLGPRLRTPAAAHYLGIADSTLEKMRGSGTGPEFETAGKAVVYSIPALEEYLAQRRARSTSEAGKLPPRSKRRNKNGADPDAPPRLEDNTPDDPDDGAV